MAIWFDPPSLEAMNARCADTLIHNLGIEFTEIGEDYLRGTMPVDTHTRQPRGFLHGGASLALAETLGSYASALCVDPETKILFGQEINANHLRPAREGTMVTGTARPYHLGRSSHVWEIRITGEEGRLVCIARHTVSIRDK